jgi:DNA topoisomerase-1
LKNCGEYPGSELFQYLDEQGQRTQYRFGRRQQLPAQISGREITAKDFRTWAATNLAALALSVLDEDKPSKKGTLQDCLSGRLSCFAS